MEKSRRIIVNTQQQEKKCLSKTQEKKRRRRKYPNVFFKKELTATFDTIETPEIMIGAFLTFFCALRNSEVCRLKWADINLQECRLKVVDGKNHKDGFIPISPPVIPVLKKWREMNPDQVYLLPSDKYKIGHLRQDTVLKNFKKALKKAGLEILTEKNAEGRQQHQYKFHTLRHSRCTHLLSNGVPVEKVQKFMRHDDLETTMTYTWILDKELNKMVNQADTSTLDFEQNTAERTSIHQRPKENPVEIAQKRLAYGEITIKEYHKITRALTGIT